MKSIANINNGNKGNGKPKSEATRTIERINRLRESFQEIEPGSQTKVLEMLSGEIEETEDENIRFWLIRFRSILENVGGAK
ncbi:MAG TPA: hypothetical protein VGC97_00065 [Pyrinomonadaceae bacterium]|jgi:hypothetical protein